MGRACLWNKTFASAPDSWPSEQPQLASAANNAPANAPDMPAAPAVTPSPEPGGAEYIETPIYEAVLVGPCPDEENLGPEYESAIALGDEMWEVAGRDAGPKLISNERSNSFRYRAVISRAEACSVTRSR